MVAIPGAIPDGYYKDDAKTASTFREIDGVRYSIPGDWASVGADGSITLLGRGARCINTGGGRCTPQEVEGGDQTPSRGRGTVCCYAMPDERFGQRVVGIASLEAGAAASADDVLADLRTRLSTSKVPRRLELVQGTPRTPSGKADYPKAASSSKPSRLVP